MEIKQQAISKLSNSMRIYGESHMNFNRLRLVDPEEAIDDLDRAIDAKLEAFHSLYDVTKGDFDYFAHADTALLILLRNAIHHRNHPLFKSWNQEMALNDGHKRYLGAEFLLTSHDVVDASHRMRHLYKLEDFYLRIDASLGSAYLEDRMSDKNRNKLLEQFKVDLNFEAITKRAQQERYPIKQIYINIIPIFISAVCKVFKALKANGVEFIGFDAQTYEELFTCELRVDFSKIDYMPVRIR